MPSVLSPEPAHASPKALIEAMDILGIDFRRNGDKLAVRDPKKHFTDELRQACREHQADLLREADLREQQAQHLSSAPVCISAEELAELSAAAQRVSQRIISLRFSDPAKGSRAAGIAWLDAEIKRISAGVNVDAAGSPHVFSPEPPYEPMGWVSEDPFTDDCLAALLLEFDELTAEGNEYPVPLPEGCVLLPEANFDPFEHQRSYSWKAL